MQVTPSPSLSPHHQGRATPEWLSSMAHFRTLMKTLAYYRRQCVQCPLQVLPRTFLSVWYVCLSDEWPQSLANSRSNWRLAPSDQGWHIDSGHLCPAQCLRYVNHKWISDVAYAMFLLKLNDHYPTPIDIPSPYLSNHLPLMWYKQSYLRWGMFWKLQMKYSHLISLKQAIPVCLWFVYISFRQVILRSHRKWDIFFRTGVNEVTKLMT